jgi:DNA-directed RNA polymerase subunit RPC12/RpoP
MVIMKKIITEAGEGPARCYDCGVELIAPADGRPYWCTACSYEHDLKERNRR